MNDTVSLEQQHTRLREELHRTQRELRHQEQLRRNFTTLAAHELRNPLAILLGYAKILEEESSGNVREYASIVVSRAQQLKSVVDSLIVLQQVDAGELVLQPDTFLVAEGIQEVISCQQQYLYLKALRIELHIEPGLYVHADRERFALAFANVLSNAIKYLPHDGLIIIQTRADANNVIISVHDNGVGIPAKEQDHIFDRFYQVGNPPTREYSGLGIGLTVAKAIIELHHGHIWVESAPNQGSTFSFSLQRTHALKPSIVLQSPEVIATV